jgi:hypothetical protein
VAILYCPTPGSYEALSINCLKALLPWDRAIVYLGQLFKKGSGLYSEGPGIWNFLALYYNSALDLPVLAVGIVKPGALGSVHMLADIVSNCLEDGIVYTLS